MMLGIFVGTGVNGVIVAGIGMRDDGHRIVDQLRVQRLQPMDARVAAEPTHLLAGQPLGFLRDIGKRLVHIPDAVQQVDDLLITERAHGGGSQMRADTFDFLDKSIVIHLLGAQVNAMIQIRTIQIKTDLDGGNHITVARQACRIRFASKLDDFKCANGASRVAWIHTRGGFGVFIP